METPQQTPDTLARIERVSDGIFDWIAKACGWILVIMAVMITLDILLREARTVGWIDFNWQFVAEWSAYLVILLVFAGLAYTLRSDGHITVSLLTARLPSRAQVFVALLMAVISEAVVVYMFYRSILWMQISISRGITSTSAVQTPIWIPNLFVAIGLGLFVIAIALYIARQTKNLFSSVDKQVPAVRAGSPAGEA